MKKLQSNLKWLLAPYLKYARNYTIISILFWGIILPSTRYLNVIFPEVMINTILNTDTFSKIIGVVLGFQIIFFLIPAFEDFYNARIRDKAEARVEAMQKKEIYEFASKVKYEAIDQPSYYEHFTWTIENYSAKSQECFSLMEQALSAVVIILSMFVLLAKIHPLIIVLAALSSVLRTYGYFQYNKYYVERDKSVLENDRRLDYFHRVFYMKDYAVDLKTTCLKHILHRKYDYNIQEKEDKIENFSYDLVRWAWFSDVIYHVFMIGIILYVAYMIYSGKISDAASYITIMLSIEQLDQNMYQLFELMQDMNKLDIYADEIKAFYDAPVEEQKTDTKELSLPYSLKLEHLYFHYPNSSFTIEDLNLNILPGQKIAIVGENGAGKTTLMKLLLRLYEPEQGTIRINGIDIKNIPLKQLRNTVGAVPQSANIYAFSCRENLQLYAESTDDMLLKHAESVGLTDVLKKDNGNLNSEMTREFDDNGIVLSGGEVQRLALARVLTGKFGLLLLDEPSSALDPIAESKLTEDFNEKTKDITTITVAHRLSTIRNADCIYVMSNGKVIESGTHEELMKQNGLYKEMFTDQAKYYQT